MCMQQLQSDSDAVKPAENAVEDAEGGLANPDANKVEATLKEAQQQQVELVRQLKEVQKLCASSSEGVSELFDLSTVVIEELRWL